jgi:hypothetical protein
MKVLVPGICDGCGTSTMLLPLHGEKGGPLRCPLCVGKWNAEHTRRRKWGRIVIKAMKMFEKEGGRWSDFDKLKMAATGFFPVPGYEDTIGAEVGDITSELLDDVLQLTHPDRHPPERRELAHRVTQELLALRPFVFPAQKPKSKPNPFTPPPRDGSVNPSQEDLKQPSRAYPCELCADTTPYFYCDSCKAEWTKREEEKSNREREKQRKWYRGRRQRLKDYRPLHCVTCGKKIEANRRDAKFCSSACRQKHHRQKDVTAPSKLTAKLETAVTLKRRKVWKLQERNGHLWCGDIQVTTGGGPGKYPHGSIGWYRGDWRANGSALWRLGVRKNYWEPIHRCSDCEGWILGHPNTLRCDECKALRLPVTRAA